MLRDPKEYAREAAYVFAANSDQHFPGRPLFEGLVAKAVRQAVSDALDEVDPIDSSVTARLIRERLEGS